MDELIEEYSKILREIYARRTAGSHTWEGVLAEFARKVTELEIHAKIAELREESGERLL
jgi:hypothetical protein